MKFLSVAMFALVASLALAACLSKGACEERIEFVGSDGTTLFLYRCGDEVDREYCDNDPYSADHDQVLHAGTTCSSLGYAELDFAGYMHNPPDYTPGAYGAWGSGSGGGGGGSGVCAGDYQSVGDAQLDGYCGSAYNYICLQGMSASSPEVQAVCTYYDDMGTSNAPSCPYCD